MYLSRRSRSASQIIGLPVNEDLKIDDQGIQTTDGPNGARGESYVSGIRAACFPCATSLGSTFDVNLLYRVGVEVAKEAKSKSADVLLAPTCNIIRSPLGDEILAETVVTVN